MFHQQVFAPGERLVPSRQPKNSGIAEGRKTNGLVRLQDHGSLDSKEQAAVGLAENPPAKPVWRWRYRAWGHKIRIAPPCVLNKTDMPCGA
jgi:hypothetical protein